MCSSWQFKTIFQVRRGSITSAFVSEGLAAGLASDGDDCDDDDLLGTGLLSGASNVASDITDNGGIVSDLLDGEDDCDCEDTTDNGNGTLSGASATVSGTEANALSLASGYTGSSDDTDDADDTTNTLTAESVSSTAASSSLSSAADTGSFDSPDDGDDGDDEEDDDVTTTTTTTATLPTDYSATAAYDDSTVAPTVAPVTPATTTTTTTNNAANARYPVDSSAENTDAIGAFYDRNGGRTTTYTRGSRFHASIFHASGQSATIGTGSTDSSLLNGLSAAVGSADTSSADISSSGTTSSSATAPRAAGGSCLVPSAAERGMRGDDRLRLDLEISALMEMDRDDAAKTILGRRQRCLEQTSRPSVLWDLRLLRLAASSGHDEAASI